MFADPDFDGDPARITEEEVNDAGETISTTETIPDGQEPEPATPEEGEPGVIEPPTGEPRKFYFDGGQVEVVALSLIHISPMRVLSSDKARAEYRGVSRPARFRWLNQSTVLPCGSVSEIMTGPSPACSAATAR